MRTPTEVIQEVREWTKILPEKDTAERSWQLSQVVIPSSPQRVYGGTVVKVPRSVIKWNEYLFVYLKATMHKGDIKQCRDLSRPLLSAITFC